MTVVRTIPFSGQIKKQCEAAWASVEDDCNKILQPDNGNMKFFYPTEDCSLTIKYIQDEYPQQAASSLELYKGKPRKISDYRHAGFVYFPGDTVIESFTIVVPLRISGQVKIGEVTMDEKHYYHVLNKAMLSVMVDSRLEAIAVSKIQ
ncbi:hypothetical protein PHISCL_08620 [Aspergillus sclerotialis]|uniref:Uncharacterized protein n=1 Tax=Aspergillus sclerotialis TaxID=2070753 RepID=A0A3A2ZCK1_9EURO|nr:hypothetical protein PHISCL_08620 [Aspergillus sclerotialis]